MAPCDLGFLVFGVTRDTDHFHTVEKRRRDVERVRGRHEHYVGEIVIYFEVMVVEGVVLLRVETSSNAADGSPRKSMPILSISSSRISGLEVFAFLIDWMILPGIEPI